MNVKALVASWQHLQTLAADPTVLAGAEALISEGVALLPEPYGGEFATALKVFRAIEPLVEKLAAIAAEVAAAAKAALGQTQTTPPESTGSAP